MLQNYDPETDKAFLREFLLRAAQLPPELRIGALDHFTYAPPEERAIDSFVDVAYRASRYSREDAFMDALGQSPDSLAKRFDAFVQFATDLAPTYRELREKRQRWDGRLSVLWAKYVDVKEAFTRKDFIPDANSTLRLTFGRIQGYTPADALYASPITTMRGVLEKTTGVEPYDTPANVIETYRAKQYGRFRSKKLNDIPVALLYNLDTTGGNSGSPLLDAAGDVVGVNFDRTYEATINDYAWNADYSRSIGVDIRYVLWITGTVAGAADLLQEMGVPAAR